MLYSSRSWHHVIRTSLDGIKRQSGDQVGGWLGGVAKAVGRAAAQNPLVAQNIKYGRAVLAGPTALAKTAAIDLAAGAAGAGVGKAAVGVGRVVSKTGVPARVVNKLTGQKVVVHASPQTGLNRIDPRLGSNQLPDKNVVFGWDPKKSGMRDQITRLAGRYVSKQEGQSAGSIYVTSIRKSEIVTPQNLANTGQVVSRGSGRVVSEIPVSGKTTAQVNAELQRQLRLAGAVSKPTVSRTADAAERVRSKVGQTFMTKAQKDAARRKRIR
jgi:hypothetical protein